MPRAGNVADSSPRATVTSPLSSGWRSASITSVRKSGNSSRNSTPQWARLISPGPHPAGAAADQAGLAGVVVGREERRPGEQVVAGLERPGQRVDGGQLERLLRGSGRAGCRGSARRGWSCRHPSARTASGGGRPRPRPRRRTARRPCRAGRPCRAPPAAPGRARTAAGCRTSARPAAPRAPRRRAARRRPGASERIPSTAMPGTIAASRACGSGTKTRRDAARGGRHHHRQHARAPSAARR